MVQLVPEIFVDLELQSMTTLQDIDVAQAIILRKVHTGQRCHPVHILVVRPQSVHELFFSELMSAIVYRIAFAALCQESVKIFLRLEEIEEAKRSVRVEVMEIVKHVKVADI